MSTHAYNFHQFVEVQIESEDPGLLGFFDAEYLPYSVPVSQQIYQVSLRWKKSFWPLHQGYHFQMHKLLARWSYKIAMQEHGIRIGTIGNSTAVPMIHHMLVHPSLRYLCSQQDVLMLHGSSVVNDNNSLVFTGTGGTGKTTVSSLMLKSGGNEWKLHADDYVFLGKDSLSFSYVTRSHLYRDQLRWVPSIRSVLSPRERTHLELFGRLREFTRDRIKWPLRIEPSRLWSDHRIAHQAHLGAIIFLSRSNLDRFNLEKIEVTQGVIEELLQMNFYEARHFIQLMRKAFGESYQQEWLAQWKKREQKLLQRILRESPVFRLHLPSGDIAPNQFGTELVQILKPLVGKG
jgi:hypothetical protein